VVRATVLRTRIADGSTAAELREDPLELGGPEAGEAPPVEPHRRMGFVSGMTFRTVRGSMRERGPAAVWCRFDRTIVAGMPNSPAMAAAAAGDFCNGLSPVVSFREWTFINADLTISFARAPVGEWILVDAETTLGPDGAGFAAARLGDRHGYFGRSVQSILVERR